MELESMLHINAEAQAMHVTIRGTSIISHLMHVLGVCRRKSWKPAVHRH